MQRLILASNITYLFQPTKYHTVKYQNAYHYYLNDWCLISFLFVLMSVPSDPCLPLSHCFPWVTLIPTQLLTHSLFYCIITLIQNIDPDLLVFAYTPVGKFLRIRWEVTYSQSLIIMLVVAYLLLNFISYYFCIYIYTFSIYIYLA